MEIQCRQARKIELAHHAASRSLLMWCTRSCSDEPFKQQRTCTQQAWMADFTAAWISSTSSAAQGNAGQWPEPFRLLSTLPMPHRVRNMMSTPLRQGPTCCYARRRRTYVLLAGALEWDLGGNQADKHAHLLAQGQQGREAEACCPSRQQSSRLAK